MATETITTCDACNERIRGGILLMQIINRDCSPIHSRDYCEGCGKFATVQELYEWMWKVSKSADETLTIHVSPKRNEAPKE